AQVHRFLAAVAAGQLNGTLALHEGGRWDPFSIGATATPDGDGWVLSGHKHQVLCCAEVDEVVVAARREPGALGLFVVPAAELTFSRVTSLDGTRSLGNLELNGVWVPEARMLGDPLASTDATPALSAMLAEATVGIALDVLGICDALFQSSLDVALDGVGGGREPGSDATPPGGIEAIAAPVDTALDRNGRRADPLSSASRVPARSPAQATKHRLIDMLMALERARATVYHAVAAVSEGHERAAVIASEAKAAAGGLPARGHEQRRRGARRRTPPERGKPLGAARPGRRAAVGVVGRPPPRRRRRSPPRPQAPGQLWVRFRRRTGPVVRRGACRGRARRRGRAR
ncbi:MAG TPA: hypothetical protein VKA42_07190, partial [Acidimicrobiales bacterium]|nr:hypothetical protein [Acidimicrobiales bacterium]